MKHKGALIVGPVVSLFAAGVMALSGASLLSVIAVFLIAGPLASLLFAVFATLPAAQNRSRPESKAHGFDSDAPQGAARDGKAGR